MRLNKLIISLFITTVIVSQCYADNRGYLKFVFANKDAVPAYRIVAPKGQQTNSSYQITFTDSNLNKIFSNYTVLDFEKEYPIADSFPDDQAPAVRLRLVYKVIIDTTTGKSYDDLKKSTDSIGSRLVNATVRFLPPMSLANPNDYSLNLPNYPADFPTVADQLNLINASGAWNITTGLSCIKIGIVEPDNTFQKHVDFINTDGTSKIVVSQGRSIDPVDAYPISPSNCSSYGPNSALCYHGESTAGLAAAATNNSIGIASLGYNVSAQLYSQSYIGIVNAIYDNCKVVSCSWGVPSQVLSVSEAQDILDLANLNNATIVAAAGNGKGSNGALTAEDYFYPASYDGVISVTSVGSQWNVGDSHGANWKDCHKEFFNPLVGDTSFTHTHNDKVDMCAPGYFVQILAHNNTYNASGGTSYAAPQVAAAAALLYSVNPFFTPLQIQNYLYTYGDNIDNACIINGVSDNQRWANKIGHRLNAGASLQAASSNTYNGPAYCSCPTATTPTYITNTVYTANDPKPKGDFYNYDIIIGSNNSGYVMSDPNAITSLTATNSVTLQAGFDANPGNGAYFEAYIKPCPNPGGNREATSAKSSLINSSSNSLQLYPNPATSEVHLFFTITKDEKALIRVVNNLGVTLKTKSVVSSKSGSGNAVFDTRSLSAGIYYILLTGTNGSHMVKKLIKTNP